jgi:hypothetical protein
VWPLRQWPPRECILRIALLYSFLVVTSVRDRVPSEWRMSDRRRMDVDEAYAVQSRAAIKACSSDLGTNNAKRDAVLCLGRCTIYKCGRCSHHRSALCMAAVPVRRNAVFHFIFMIRELRSSSGSSRQTFQFKVFLVSGCPFVASGVLEIDITKIARLQAQCSDLS